MDRRAAAGCHPLQEGRAALKPLTASPMNWRPRLAEDLIGQAKRVASVRLDSSSIHSAACTISANFFERLSDPLNFAKACASSSIQHFNPFKKRPVFTLAKSLVAHLSR